MDACATALIAAWCGCVCRVQAHHPWRCIVLPSYQVYVDQSLLIAPFKMQFPPPPLNQSQMVCFSEFFFFTFFKIFLKQHLFRPKLDRFGAISTRFRPNWPVSGQIKIKINKKKSLWMHVQLHRQQHSMVCVGCGCAAPGGAPMLPSYQVYVYLLLIDHLTK